MYIFLAPGEDRWLCNLLLQQGYRVEYCAAADSFTFAPEGLSEFFNQRRRWMPSTMANVLDILMSWRHASTMNENISMIYIGYQALLLVTSLVGPGLIFLMITSSIDIALGGNLGLTWSGIINIIPILIFVILCYVASGEVQV